MLGFEYSGGAVKVVLLSCVGLSLDKWKEVKELTGWHKEDTTVGCQSKLGWEQETGEASWQQTHAEPTCEDLSIV